MQRPLEWWNEVVEADLHVSVSAANTPLSSVPIAIQNLKCRMGNLGHFEAAPDDAAWSQWSQIGNELVKLFGIHQASWIGRNVKPAYVRGFLDLSERLGPVVPGKGLEPLQPCGHQLLRLARLPIPPTRHTVTVYGERPGRAMEDKDRTFRQITRPRTPEQ